MDDVAELFRKNRERRDRPITPPPPISPPSSPPHRPFAEAAASTSNTTRATASTNEEDTADDDQDLSTLPPAEPPAPRPSKTHTIITSITSLTPAHLTSPSPGLRTSLLSLLTTSLPLLSRDTDSFLPIAATLYPYISTRLFSSTTTTTTSTAPLPFEIQAAAQAMATLLHCAGDFMKSRTDAEWPRFMKLFKRVEGQMREEVRASRGRVGGSWWRAWDAVVGCIVAVVRDVGVGDEGEDGVFEILGGYVGGPEPEEEEETAGVRKGGGAMRSKGRDLVVKGRGLGGEVMSKERREEVEECLQDLNPDFLWLVQERGRVQRGGERLKKPEGVAGLEFRDIDY